MKTRRIATQGRPEYHTLDGPFRGPIRRTAANLATRSVLFCSVLFCSHTGLPHMDSPLFKNTCRAASHGRPQFKNDSFKFPIPKFTIQFLSIQFHASRVPIMQFYTNSNDCSTFTTCSLSTRLRKRTTYLNPCIFVLFVKRPGTRTCIFSAFV
jgi:hypothetical protein